MYAFAGPSEDAQMATALLAAMVQPYWGLPVPNAYEAALFEFALRNGSVRCDAVGVRVRAPDMGWWEGAPLACASRATGDQSFFGWMRERVTTFSSDIADAGVCVQSGRENAPGEPSFMTLQWECPRSAGDSNPYRAALPILGAAMDAAMAIDPLTVIFGTGKVTKWEGADGSAWLTAALDAFFAVQVAQSQAPGPARVVYAPILAAPVRDAIGAVVA